jgi:octaprenyl-diphosphate synthase
MEVGSPLIERLGRLSRDRNVPAVAARLEALMPLVGPEMGAIERSLAAVEGHRDVHRGAAHLISRSGKRMRPLCVALAAKLGRGFDARGLELAVAVELVHSATLLHDDVVDLGDSRRGAPTTRIVYGNAISIFAGDWLLIDALRRVRRTGIPLVLERLFDVVDEMIVAESLQLERRGKLETSAEAWLAVAHGKTAALFRWAMFAGARAGELSLEQAETLDRFGAHCGIAFQAIDDVLDLAGDPATTGKLPFADLREGKCSLPVAYAIEADPSLTARVKAAAAEGADESATKELSRAIAATGALVRAREHAFDHIASAVAALEPFPPSDARTALVSVARAMVEREV